MHERATIRHAVITALTNATSAGARVGPSRLPPRRGKLLPAISVYVIDETVDDVTATCLRRTATVAVDAWVSTVKPEDLEDALDAICLQVETVLEADPFLGSTVILLGLKLESTEIGVKLETNQPQGCAHLEFTVVYETAPRVAAPADDFLRVNAKTVAPAPISEGQFNVR